MGRGKASVRSGLSFLEHRKHRPLDGLLAQHLRLKLKSGAAIRTVSDGPGQSACPTFKAKAKKWCGHAAPSPMALTTLMIVQLNFYAFMYMYIKRVAL